MQYKHHNKSILEKAKKSDGLVTRIIDGSLRKEDIQEHHLSEIHIGRAFCENCDACFDAAFNLKLIIEFVTGHIDRTNVSKQKQAWRYSFLTDKAIHGLGDLSKLKTDKKLVTISGPICYIDQNILTQAVNDSNFYSLLLELRNKRGIKISCSVSHHEEIYKIINPEERQKFIDTIKSLTDEINLQPNSANDQIDLFFENTSTTLSRIEMTANSSEAVEMLKNLKNEDRRLYFEKYNDLNIRKKLGQASNIFDSLPDNEFSQLIAMSCPPGNNKSDFKGLESHSDIRNAIYSLHNAMDLMSFKQDKSERTQRSSAHDIEHLIYGSRCNYFITNDANLRSRAFEIYSFLEFSVQVLPSSDIKFIHSHNAPS